MSLAIPRRAWAAGTSFLLVRLKPMKAHPDIRAELPMLVLAAAVALLSQWAIHFFF